MMQHSVKDANMADVLNKEKVEMLMQEYKNVVLYIGEKKLTEETLTPEEDEKLRSMAPTYIELFGKDVCDVFMQDVLKIPKLADYFGVNLDDFIK